MSRYKRLRSRQFFVRTIWGRPLAGRLDDIAIAAARHHAILQLAGGGEVWGEPQTDTENHGGNDQACDSAAAAVAGLGLCRRSGLLRLALLRLAVSGRFGPAGFR